MLVRLAATDFLQDAGIPSLKLVMASRRLPCWRQGPTCGALHGYRGGEHERHRVREDRERALAACRYRGYVQGRSATASRWWTCRRARAFCKTLFSPCSRPRDRGGVAAGRGARRAHKSSVATQATCTGLVGSLSRSPSRKKHVHQNEHESRHLRLAACRPRLPSLAALTKE